MKLCITKLYQQKNSKITSNKPKTATNISNISTNTTNKYPDIFCFVYDAGLTN